ncbi:MAG TPA: insulinase family protein [Gemmatimonadetes bacterium]|nr:insulinase family protein [Gemmatimonadota bacterium]
MRPRAGFLTTMLAIMVVAAVPVVTPTAIGVQPAAAAVRLVTQTQQSPALEHARTGALRDPMPVGPGVTVGQLENGLQYYIRENSEPANRAEFSLVVKVGSVVEDEDQLGLAHFLEHMAFNGTENFEKQELIDFMESIGMRMGADLNAGTSFDETRYMLQIPTDSPEVMANTFQILEDWAHGLTLDPEEIDKERGVIIEEWRLRRGAAARIQDEQFPVLLRDSRYAERSPIGTVESLETFEHEALRRFYRDWYRPDLMAVIAVGDFDRAEVEALLIEHFEGISAPENPRERIEYSVPDHDETLFTIATDEELTSTSVAVYHMLALDEQETIGGYRQQLVEGLYNGMLNLRLGEIARNPNPPFLGAGSSKGSLVRSKGAYLLSANVPEDGIERGLEVVFTEAERVARFGFTASELERQKIDVLRGIERAYTDRANRGSASYAAEYSRAFLDDEPIPGIEYEFELYKRFIPEITLTEVNQIGSEWIRPQNRVVVVTGPEKEDLDMPSEEALLAVLTGVADMEITAYEETVIDQPLLAEIPEGSTVVGTREFAEDIVEWELGNGVRVALKPTDFREDQVLFQGFSPGGTSLASDEEWIPASSATVLIQGGGLGPFNTTDLRRVLTGKVASARPFISSFEEGVTGSGSPQDLETMFQLIYMTFTAPRADPEYFEVFNTRNRTSLQNRDASPAVAFNDAINRIMTQDALRSRPVTVETLDHTDLGGSLAFYQDRFEDASDFTFIFVGNIDLDVMRPLVERYLGGLPSTNRVETWRDLGERPPRGVIEEIVRKGLEPQSQTRLFFTGSIDYGDRSQRLGIAVMTSVLETRLREVLREELGGTYSVSVGSSFSWRPAGQYRLSISFGSDPERADELLAAVYEEIDRLKSSPPDEAEVNDVLEAQRRAWETNQESNSWWLSVLDGRYRYLLDQSDGRYPSGDVLLETLPTYGADLDALTPPRIQELARRYFDQDNRVRVTLLPEQLN